MQQVQKLKPVKPKSLKARSARGIRRISEYAICGRCGHHTFFHAATAGPSTTACAANCDCEQFVSATKFFGRNLGRSWAREIVNNND